MAHQPRGEERQVRFQAYRALLAEVRNDEHVAAIRAYLQQQRA